MPNAPKAEVCHHTMAVPVQESVLRDVEEKDAHVEDHKELLFVDHQLYVRPSYFELKSAETDILSCGYLAMTMHGRKRCGQLVEQPAFCKLLIGFTSL